MRNGGIDPHTTVNGDIAKVRYQSTATGVFNIIGSIESTKMSQIERAIMPGHYDISKPERTS